MEFSAEKMEGELAWEVDEAEGSLLAEFHVNQDITSEELADKISLEALREASRDVKKYVSKEFGKHHK